MDLTLLKKEAGYRAAQLAESGMVIGLGTGSTAFYAIERIAERIAEEKLELSAVSTSFSTTLLCREKGIPLLDLAAVARLDLAIDGADEIDPARNLIKGRGGAHLIEKMVARMADRFVVIADHTKQVVTLGEKVAVPIEVHPLALTSVQMQLKELGSTEVTLRMAGPSKDGPVISDSGNLILDARFTEISDPSGLSARLDSLPGLLAHGIFPRLCSRVILASPDGVMEF